MDHEKQILDYIGARRWTWIAGLAMTAGGMLVIGAIDSIWMLGGIAAIFVGVYYLLRALTVDLPAIRRGKKSLERLRQSGQLEQAAQELSTGGDLTIGRDKTLFTEHFLFGRQNGTAICYEDILWAYKSRFTQRVVGIPVKTVDSLTVSTASQKKLCAVNMGKRDKKNELDAALARIYEKNPKVLMGYTKENQQAYRELTKA